MKRQKTECYQKPELTKVKIIPEKSLFTGPRNEASSWSGDSCYKICRKKSLNTDKVVVETTIPE